MTKESIYQVKLDVVAVLLAKVYMISVIKPKLKGRGSNQGEKQGQEWI